MMMKKIQKLRVKLRVNLILMPMVKPTLRQTVRPKENEIQKAKQIPRLKD